MTRPGVQSIYFEADAREKNELSIEDDIARADGVAIEDEHLVGEDPLPTLESNELYLLGVSYTTQSIE
jgi:hypothetical protein